MKTLRWVLLVFLFGPGLAGAAPRLYVAGHAGVFNAEAGNAAAYQIYLSNEIKSGTKSFVDFSLGVELCDWFSLEAGYVDFASFSSRVFQLRPEIIPVRAEAVWQTYDLRGFRLTPVFRVFSVNGFALKILGGVIHPTGEVLTRDRFLPGWGGTTHELKEFAAHAGAAVSYALSDHASLEGRIVYYDFGKPDHDPNRITALAYSLGLAWRF